MSEQTPPATATGIVFSTQAYAYMAADICRVSGYEQGLITLKHFPDGERFLRIDTPVDGREVVLVGGTIGDSDTLELYDLACGMVQCGATRLTLVIPYFGYSTMERGKGGEIVTAKTRARILSAVPPAAWGNRLILLDLHSEGIPYYFEGRLQPLHVYARPLVLEAARRLAGLDTQFVLACTDAGRAKWVESLANDLGVPASFVFKRRLDGAHTTVTAVSAQVRDQHVIIYDDMIRTGGSLLGAARAYWEAGAKSVAAIATHGLFPADALQVLEQSGLFSRIITTDSHPRARALSGAFLEVVPVGPLLGLHLHGLLP